MSVAKAQDTVKVHYTGKLSDGEIFDSSVDRDPLEFTLGSGQVIPGFDQAIEGMTIEESKTVTIPADEAYGPVNEELVQEVGLNQLPEDMKPEVGQTLVASSPDGNQVHVQITAVGAENITVDANHPLAGKDLTFELRLVEIV